MSYSPTQRDFQSASSITKALNILEFVGLGGRRSLSEISEHMGLPRSTLLRLIAVLLDQGFLRRVGHGQYGVALKLWRIGCSAVDFETLHDRIVPTLRLLVEKTSETALYAVYDGGRTTYVERVEGLHPIRAYASVGSQSPAYACATGKALLAWRAEEEIVRVAAAAERFTKATLVGAKALVREASEIRRNGFSVNRGEWREGVWGVAAPIFAREPEPIAAIGVTGPRDRIEPQIEAFSGIVRAAADELSAHSGAIPLGPNGRNGATTRSAAHAADLQKSAAMAVRKPETTRSQAGRVVPRSP